MHKTILLTTAAFALAACGGTTTTPTPTPAPTTRTAVTQTVNASGGGINDTLTVQYAPATDTLTFASAARGALNLAADPNYDLGRIKGYRSNNERWGYAIRTTDSQAAVVATNGDTPAEGIGAVQTTRLTTVTAPLSGAGTFNGDYAGFVRSNSNTNNVNFHVDGDVSLVANFAGNQVNGSITNRNFWNLGQQSSRSPAGSLQNLTLNPTTLDSNLAFAGSTTGGGIVTGGGTTAPGQYTGMVNGSTAAETVGAVGVTHTWLGGTYNEIGIFQGNR